LWTFVKPVMSLRVL